MHLKFRNNHISFVIVQLQSWFRRLIPGIKHPENYFASSAQFVLQREFQVTVHWFPAFCIKIITPGVGIWFAKKSLPKKQLRAILILLQTPQKIIEYKYFNFTSDYCGNRWDTLAPYRKQLLHSLIAKRILWRRPRRIFRS